MADEAHWALQNVVSRCEGGGVFPALISFCRRRIYIISLLIAEIDGCVFIEEGLPVLDLPGRSLLSVTAGKGAAEMVLAHVPDFLNRCPK
jgi:hypothetical protein